MGVAWLSELDARPNAVEFINRLLDAARSEGPQPPAVKVDEGALVPQAALDWLFGLGDSFEPQPGQRGNFWWRTEFQRRAGLPSLGSRHEG